MKMKDSPNSSNDFDVSAPRVSSKKTGSIKIKSPKRFNSSTIIHTSNEKSAQSEAACPDETNQGPNYNRAELDAAHVVIKKVMKMDAAEPFNVLVNPIGLGIPDYFDVIDTPMDFGTICRNLEIGSKYMNSEDVYKDVQYIWGNCYKYNNKGDYILELMKRVKKNFTKYWAAAKLYSEQLSKSGVVHGVEEEGCEGKVFSKGSQSKNKAKKRHGYKKHKEDCGCAICIMKRRRVEREQNAETSDANVVVKLKKKKKKKKRKQEGSGCNERDMEAVKMEEHRGEVKEIAMIEAEEGEIMEEESAAGEKQEAAAEITVHEEEEAKPKERVKGEQWIDGYEMANSMVVDICGTLFTPNPNSVWCAPRSLIQHPTTNSNSNSNSNSIHAAIATFSS